ncbi:hypothetical protein SNK03_011970 [Fusarium graminearum]
MVTGLEPMTSSKKNEVSNTAGESTRKLQDILEAAHSAMDHDANSSDSGSDYGPDSFIEISKDLETDTMCLMALDTLFQSVEMEPFVEKTAFADEAQSWLPHDIYKDKIQTRFPRAENSLILRLSKTAYHRYLRCQKERLNQAAEVGNTDPPTRSEGSSSKFHDSGLGTSDPSSASVAETVMSYHTEGGNPIRIPPLSKEAKEGQPFECVSCDLESDAESEGDSVFSGSQVESISEKNDTADPHTDIPGKPVLQHARDYVEEVKVAFLDRPHVYRRFLDILSDYNSNVLDLKSVVHEVRDLFVGTNHENLSSMMVGFSRFLPSGFFIDSDFNLRFPDDATPPDELDASEIRPTGGDAVLIAYLKYLNNGSDPEIARAAGESLPPDDVSISVYTPSTGSLIDQDEE